MSIISYLFLSGLGKHISRYNLLEQSFKCVVLCRIVILVWEMFFFLALESMILCFCV